MSEPMTDLELEALTALVNFELREWQYGVDRYGEAQWDPWTPPRRALTKELDRRSLFGEPALAAAQEELAL